MQKNIASQQFVVFAFNATTNVPITGDAANITATISKDFAADVATNDVNPTETQKGFYVFDATQAETNANDIQIFPSSVTADIQVISVPGLITTVPVSFGDNIIQTADNNTILVKIPLSDGTNTWNSTALASINAECDTALTDYDGPTNAEMVARTRLDADYFSWTTDTVANVTAVATTTDLTNLPSIPSNWLTSAGIAASALDGKGDWNIGKTGYSINGTITTLDGLKNFDPAVDAVANVTLVATTTAVTNELSVNTAKINGVNVIGTGITSDKWRA